MIVLSAIFVSMLFYSSFFTNPQGIIDSIRVYNRVLTEDEVNSNYQVLNVEFQTRTSADSSSWEGWKPVTSESQIDSIDGPYQYNTTDSGLVSYWPMDETSGTNVDDPKGDNDGTANGTTIVDGDFIEASKNGTMDKKDHPGLQRSKGHIGFLGHGDVVRFKNIRIKDLSPN